MINVLTKSSRSSLNGFSVTPPIRALKKSLLPLIIPHRTIVYNEDLAKRGLIEYKSGYGEVGFSKVGTHEGMEEFMVDDIPDRIIQLHTTLPDIASNFFPNAVVGHIFDGFQALSGMPWWSAIMAVGALYKLSSYPIHVWWRRECQEYVKTIPAQAVAFLDTYFQSIAHNGSREAMLQAFRAQAKVSQELNASVAPSLFPGYLSLIYSSTMALGILYLTNLTYAPLLTGGSLWFPDLSQHDPYYLLPVINSALIILNTRLHPLGFLLPFPVFAMGYRWKVPMILMVMSQFWLSSGALLYFISVNTTGLVIQALLKTSTVRNHHGLKSQEQMLLPFFEKSSDVIEIGTQIGVAKEKILEIKRAEMKVIEEGIEREKLLTELGDKVVK